VLHQHTKSPYLFRRMTDPGIDQPLIDAGGFCSPETHHALNYHLIAWMIKITDNG